MYLGIEIGGTKLQLGVGDGKGPELAALVRRDIDARRGADGILEQIEETARDLLRQYPVSCVGVGFGGPVDSASGRVIISHQIEGWKDFALGQWFRDRLGLAARIGNDCDAAASAEARYGAGREQSSVFYVTVGTGIGGGFVVDGLLHGTGRPAAAEIGHLRPGLWTDRPDATVESMASGAGIAEFAKATVRQRLAELARLDGGSDSALSVGDTIQQADCVDLVRRAGDDIDNLTGKQVGQAAADGNRIAISVMSRACRVLGWAIAQTVTLLAPEVVVIGGGVSLMGEELFFAPVRRAVREFVFPPLANSYFVQPAALGELVVVHGAIALAATAD